MRLGWVSLMLSDGRGEVKPGVDKYHCDQKKTCDAGLGIHCLGVYDTRKEKARKKDHYTVAFRSSERPSAVSEIRVRSGFAYFLSADSPALLSSPHRQLEGCYRLAVRSGWNRVVNADTAAGAASAAAAAVDATAAADPAAAAVDAGAADPAAAAVDATAAAGNSGSSTLGSSSSSSSSGATTLRTGSGNRITKKTNPSRKSLDGIRRNVSKSEEEQIRTQLDAIQGPYKPTFVTTTYGLVRQKPEPTITLHTGLYPYRRLGPVEQEQEYLCWTLFKAIITLDGLPFFEMSNRSVTKGKKNKRKKYSGPNKIWKFPCPYCCGVHVYRGAKRHGDDSAKSKTVITSSPFRQAAQLWWHIVDNGHFWFVNNQPITFGLMLAQIQGKIPFQPVYLAELNNGSTTMYV